MIALLGLGAIGVLRYLASNLDKEQVEEALEQQPEPERQIVRQAINDPEYFTRIVKSKAS